MAGAPGWALALLSLLGPACTDNVTCVFTTGCTNNSGKTSDNEAELPVDGDRIVDAPPEVEAFFPTGTQISGTTPIVVVFTESMRESTLQGALDLIPTAAGAPGQPIRLTQELVSDGQVLVLLPQVPEPLEAGGYALVAREGEVLTDLTGQELVLDEDRVLGDFTVPETGPAGLTLVTTFPPSGAAGQSETPEIVVVFDRPVDVTTVTRDSFDVRVNGNDPPNDPPARPLVIGNGPATDSRVFLYRSLLPDGRPAALGTGAEVTVELSPSGDSIEDTDGTILPRKTITFDTQPLSPPLGASLLSDPNDAIGIANLTAGNLEELMVEVELDGAEPGDMLDLLLFGHEKSTQEDPPLVALLPRTVRVSGTAPIQSALFASEDVGLGDPDDARLEDGSVTFAFRIRRGLNVTPIRVLDLDPDPDTIQDVLLDTQRPEVTELFGTGEVDEFRSDLRGLSLAGLADEELRSAEVTTPTSNNGSLAPVVGSQANAFLAAPVDLGLLGGVDTTYSLVVRDAALNASAVVDGAYKQLGGNGPGSFAPGLAVEVEVFDAGTLAPLAGALVLVHSDLGDGVNFPFFQSGTTVADGRVTVPTQGAPAVDAIVTVVRPSYDLFTLHGLLNTRLSIPLRATNEPTAEAAGVVATNDPLAVAILRDLDQRFDDSRRPVELERGSPGLGCPPASGGVVTCPADEVEIHPNRSGARSFLAGDFMQGEGAFSAGQLLQAFVLGVPFAPVEPDERQVTSLQVESMLIDQDTPPEEEVQAVPAFVFRVDSTSGVNLADLADDPTTSGKPFVSVDTRVPGLPGSIAVGLGLAFDLVCAQPGATCWTIRAAFPGAITAAGSLGSTATVDTDPSVRVEARDTPGNTAGVRPRLSSIPAGGPPEEFLALPVPTQLAPVANASSGGQAFTLSLTHAIDDGRGVPGLYLVELEDVPGRRWSLWRFDPSGTAPVAIRVVDVADAGGVGLADGKVTSVVSAYAWAALSGTEFFWTDVEREFELFSRAAPLSFMKP